MEILLLVWNLWKFCTACFRACLLSFELRFPFGNERLHTLFLIFGSEKRGEQGAFITKAIFFVHVQAMDNGVLGACHRNHSIVRNRLGNCLLYTSPSPRDGL